MLKFELKQLVAVICVSFAASSFAGSVAGTGGSTEITQILNNGELIAQVRQQVATVSQLAQSYVVQYNQLREQILSGTKIAGLSISDVLKVKSDIEGYQRSLKTFGRDLEGLESMFDARMLEAKLKKMSFNDYIASESARVNSDNQAAKARVARERAMAKQVQDDIVQVKEYGRRVDQTVGVHESSQLLNGQMNLMLQQMTRLVSLTAESQGSDKAEQLNNEAATRERVSQNAQELKSANDALRQRDLTGLDQLKAYQPPAGN
jgi:conjugal transfer/entry exclusion protein